MSMIFSSLTPSNRVALLQPSRYFFVFLSVAALLLWSSCADVYTAPETSSIIRMHRKVAVIKPAVSFLGNLKIEDAERAALIKTESEAIQNQMFIWLNRRIQQNGLELQVQEVHVTNRLLDTFKYANDIEELCRHLNVDAVIKSKYVMTQPMSEGAAAAFLVLSGTLTSTQKVDAQVTLYDAVRSKLLWSYAHTFEGSLGSSPQSLVNNAASSFTKRMPYFR